MPFNGSGVYSPPAADFPAVAGTLIQSTKFNNVINDIGTALSDAVTRDGQSAATANLPMGGFRHTNISDGTSRASGSANYASLAQLQDGASLWGGTAGGTADALTLTMTPVVPAYVAGQEFQFKSGASPNTGAATLAVSGLAAKALQINGAALIAGQLSAGQWYRVLYDGAAFQLEALFQFGVTAFSGTVTVIDGSFSIIGSADPTKQLGWEVDGNTTGTRRVLTPPDFNARMMTQTHGADVASAGTINLDTATGDLVDVTGTTSITAITLGEGRSATIRFTGALTLTNGASLILPGGANIQTAAGDFATFRGYAAGVVRCTVYQLATAAPTLPGLVKLVSGTIAAATLDIVMTAYTAYAHKLLVFDVIPVTDGVTLSMQVSTDGGGSYLGGTSNNDVLHFHDDNGTSVVQNSTGSAQIRLSFATNIGNGANEGISGKLTMFNTTSTAKWPRFHFDSAWISSDATPRFAEASGGGMYRAAQDTDAIRLLFSSGNFASGNWFLYGYN